MCRLRKQHIRSFPHLFILQSPPTPHHPLHHCPHRDQSDSYQVVKLKAPKYLDGMWLVWREGREEDVRECEVGSLTCEGRSGFTEMRRHLQMFSHGDSVYFCNLENLALLFYLLHRC